MNKFSLTGRSMPLPARCKAVASFTEALDRSKPELQENMNILHLMAEALMKWETIDRWQIDDLMAGKEARPPMEYNDMKDRNSQESKPSEKDNCSSLQPDQSFA